jgi:hypothetical protein
MKKLKYGWEHNGERHEDPDSFIFEIVNGEAIVKEPELMAQAHAEGRDLYEWATSRPTEKESIENFVSQLSSSWNGAFDGRYKIKFPRAARERYKAALREIIEEEIKVMAKR